MLPHLPGDRPRNLGEPPEKLRVPVPAEEDGQRLDRVLARALFWRSRASVQRLIESGAVLLPEGRPARSNRKVKAGEILTVLLPPRPPREAGPLPPAEVPILHEDDSILAVDKPAGLTVHPAGRHLEDTLAGILHRRYRREDPAQDVIPRLCHRLDKETSGVILAAKTEEARHLLGRQFEERRVRKTYLAVVHGRPPAARGILDWPLLPDKRSRIRLKMAASRDGRGLPALTRYRVLEAGAAFSLVELDLGTGRQHQIRVHLAALGHPVVGDKVYGPDEAYFLDDLDGRLTEEARSRLILPRHALHAWKLRFQHPGTLQEMEIEAPLPGDMARLLAAR